VTVVLATYAALVATLSASWQIVSWYLDRRTDLRVAVEHILVLPSVSVQLVNHSAHPVRIATITLAWQRGDVGGARMLVSHSDASAEVLSDSLTLRAVSELPDWIAPRDSAHVAIGGKRLIDTLPNDATDLRAIVGTADGRTIVAHAQTNDFGTT
jgi:hypothetical protein